MTRTQCCLYTKSLYTNEDGEIGYYLNFVFKDDDGNITDSLSINEIIHLRQLFLQANPNYFDEVYGQNLPDNATGDGSFKCDPGNGDYARAMYWILYELGVQPASNDLDDLTVLSIDEIARAAEAEDTASYTALRRLTIMRIHSPRASSSSRTAGHAAN